MKQRTACVIASLAAATFLPGVASAARLWECSSGDASRGYDEGYALEQDVLTSLWEGGGYTCISVDRYIEAINVQIDPSSAWDAYLSCRNAGIASAVQDAIFGRQKECRAPCTDSGAAIGRLTGQQFCGVYWSPQVGMMSMKASFTGTPICTIFSQQGCRSAIESYVSRSCSRERDAQREKYDELVERACKSR